MAVEDFTTYTEVDEDDRLTVTSSQVNAVAVDRNHESYLYKDKGVDYFNALDIDFVILISSISSEDCFGALGLANVIGTIADFGTTGVVVYMIEGDGPKWYIRLLRGAEVAQQTYQCSPDTVYYCTLERAAGNDTVTLKVYTDSGRNTLVSTLNVSGFGTTKWRYAYGFVNNNTGHSAKDFYGYTQNLEFQMVAPVLTKSFGFIIG